MRRSSASFVLAVALAGCTSDSGADGDGTATESGTGSETDTRADSTASGPTSDSTATSGAPTSDGSSTATTLPTSTSTAGETTDATETSAETEADTTGNDGPDANGCPADAPDTWVSCENFDAISDPQMDVSQWNVNADMIGIDADGDYDGDQMLRVTLTPGAGFGGWVTLRFGQGPEAPHIDSPEGSYDEVWVRYSLRTGEDWPGRQIGDIGEVIALNGPNWAIAADLNIQGDANLRLHPFGWTCIFDGEQPCNGMNDWSGTMQNLFSDAGDNEIFDAASAGDWRCVEAHMRLNDPGQSNGEAHVWVDGSEEHARTGVNWRGTWTDYGLNAVRFTNFAPVPDSPLSFYVDDVVVSTAPIGCE